MLGWYRRAGGSLAYALRHTYGTLLVDEGASLPEVQRQRAARGAMPPVKSQSTRAFLARGYGPGAAPEDAADHGNGGGADR